MLKTEPGQERYKLGFREEVLSQFNYLITEYGFQCVKTEVTLVRYESQKVFINIYHGRASYELNVEIGLLINSFILGEQNYTLTELVELEGAPNGTYQAYFQVSSQAGVKKFVPIIAKYVKEHAHNILIGDKSTFERLAQIRTQMSDKYLVKMTLDRVRPRAEEAWKDKRYREFVELYEPIKNDISPTESKKLVYAKKHVQSEFHP